MTYEIIEFHDIPIPMAAKFLKEYQEAMSKYSEIPELVRSMLEYATQLSKCSADNAEKAYREIINMGLKEITAAMIVNIRPRIIDELRTLLVFESSIPDESVLQKVLEVLDMYCPLEE